jgi:hypothetical protein
MKIKGGGFDLHLYLTPTRRAGFDVGEVELVDTARGGELHGLHGNT